MKNMNVKLLTEVRDFVVKHPRNVNMGVVSKETASYGTIGCIAGWGAILSGEEPSPAFVLTQFGSLFGINFVQAYRLCCTPCWPNDLAKTLLNSTPTSQAYANIVAERIDRFIETNGTQ